jgi:hypothetical protein
LRANDFAQKHTNGFSLVSAWHGTEQVSLALGSTAVCGVWGVGEVLGKEKVRDRLNNSRVLSCLAKCSARWKARPQYRHGGTLTLARMSMSCVDYVMLFPCPGGLFTHGHVCGVSPHSIFPNLVCGG